MHSLQGDDPGRGHAPWAAWAPGRAARVVCAGDETAAPALLAIADELAEERERKRARKEKKMEREAAKNREHDARQSAWQKFQAKAVKKKYGVAGDRSIGRDVTLGFIYTGL